MIRRDLVNQRLVTFNCTLGTMYMYYTDRVLFSDSHNPKWALEKSGRNGCIKTSKSKSSGQHLTITNDIMQPYSSDTWPEDYPDTKGSREIEENITLWPNSAKSRRSQSLDRRSVNWVQRFPLKINTVISKTYIKVEPLGYRLIIWKRRKKKVVYLTCEVQCWLCLRSKHPARYTSAAHSTKQTFLILYSTRKVFTSETSSCVRCWTISAKLHTVQSCQVWSRTCWFTLIVWNKCLNMRVSYSTQPVI